MFVIKLKKLLKEELKNKNYTKKENKIARKFYNLGCGNTSQLYLNKMQELQKKGEKVDAKDIEEIEH